MIFFRVDGNKNIGLGHIYRCTDFIRRQNIKNFLILTHNKYEVQKIPLLKKKIVSLKSKNHQIKQIKNLKKKHNAKLIIVDLPKINFNYQKKLKDIFSKSIFIMDLINKKFKKELVINPIIKKKEKKINNTYYGISPFLGFKKKKLLRRGEKKKNITLFLSNTSKTDKYLSIIKILKRFKDNINKIYVVYNKDIVSFKSLKRNSVGIKLINIGFTNKLNQIYNKSDFVIGGAGYDSLKRLVSKNLSINIKLAENQKKNFLFYKSTKIDLLNCKKLNYTNLNNFFSNFATIFDKTIHNVLSFEKKFNLNHKKFDKIWNKISAKYI